MKEISPGMFQVEDDQCCPLCGVKLDAFANSVEGEVPSPGDVSLCSNCTGYLVIEEGMKLRTMTADELIGLPDETLAFLASMRIKIQLFRKQHPLKKGGNDGE